MDWFYGYQQAFPDLQSPEAAEAQRATKCLYPPTVSACVYKCVWKPKEEISLTFHVIP